MKQKVIDHKRILSSSLTFVYIFSIAVTNSYCYSSDYESDLFG